MVTFRRFELDDMARLAQLIAQVEAADEEIQRSPQQVQTDLAPAVPDLTRTGWLARIETGQLIGYNYGEVTFGSAEINIWLRGAVHPAWRGQGLGHELFRHTWADLDQLRPELSKKLIYINAWAYAHDLARGRLFTRFGLQPDHIYYELEIAARAEQPIPPLPAGTVIIPWRDHDCEAAAALRNRAFSQSWGYQATTANALRRRFQTGRYQPSLSFTAWQGATMVGVIHACVDRTRPNEGELVWLAVAGPARGQGIGQALLLTAMHALRQAGVTLISLGADHYAGRVNIGLFTALGFTVRKAIIDYRQAI